MSATTLQERQRAGTHRRRLHTPGSCNSVPVAGPGLWEMVRVRFPRPQHQACFRGHYPCSNHGRSGASLQSSFSLARLRGVRGPRPGGVGGGNTQLLYDRHPGVRAATGGRRPARCI